MTVPAIMPLLFATLFALAAAGAARADEPLDDPPLSGEAEVFFEKKIRPLLAEKCFECHGADAQESGLRLDSRSAIVGGGERGPAAVSGEPSSSLLVSAVRRDGELKMPPDEPLSAGEVDNLVAWIEWKMPWPAASATAAGAESRDDRYARLRATHWAFQPIHAETPPRGDKPGSGRIDSWVQAGLDAAGLEPSPEADRYTLIRRVTFDLWGLPPDAESVAAFVADPSPDAYERLVDRLLASPRYGERWGRHWLDVARYADTRGYAFGRERRYPYAYTYRDYVIGAFNRDLPYDRFVVEQLAADLVVDADDDRALAAMGFLTVGRRFNNEHDDIDDRIDVVTRGLLGLTVACARCHDHKYDAIPTEDYYSLYGVFASASEPDPLPLIADPREVAGYAEFQAELDRLREELAAYEREKHAELVRAAREQVTEYLVRTLTAQPETVLQNLAVVSLSREELKPKLVERWRTFLAENSRAGDAALGLMHDLARLEDDQWADAANIVERWKSKPRGVEPGRINPLLRDALDGEPLESKGDLAVLYGRLLTAAGGRVRQAESDAGAPPLSAAERQLAALVLDPGTPTDIPASDLGGYLTREERNRQRELQRKIDTHQVDSPGAPPRAMVLNDADRPHDPRVFVRGHHARPGKAVPRQSPYILAGADRRPFQHGSGRRELAEAITAPDNPLTARVLVNRIWMHHFGEPLVDTPSDFGVRSVEPVQWPLLDELAGALVDHGWSIKWLHREIMCSRTYRQQSADRPECRAIDPENRLLWRMNRRRLEYEALRDSLFAVSGELDERLGGRPADLVKDPNAARRAVYGLIDRQDLPNLLRVFDFASPDQSAARRPRTSVPQQSLFMMNSPLVAARARAVVARTEIAGEPDRDVRIRAIYRQLFARSPDAAEMDIARRFLESSAEGQAINAWEQYVQILMMTNAFVFVD